VTFIRTGGIRGLRVLGMGNRTQPMNSQYLTGTNYQHEPVVLVFSDTETGGKAASDSILAVGGRIGASVRLIDAAERVKSQAFADAILIDISHPQGGIADHMLDGVDAWALSNAVPTIYSAPLEMIDQLSARMDQDHVTLLCQPDALDRVSALVGILSKPQATLNDVSTELDNLRVKRIADEVSRLGRSLARLASGAVASGDHDPGGGDRFNAVRLDFAAEPLASAAAAAIDPAEVRMQIRLRRMRDAYFSGELFADPAWDMLLDLMAARLEGEKVAVSSLCIAAAVPATTALRWIKAMCDNGLFERHADPLDGRRIFIGLSSGAANAMTAYLNEAKRIGSRQG
jgi:hypothetical protein